MGGWLNELTPLVAALPSRSRSVQHEQHAQQKPRETEQQVVPRPTNAETGVECSTKEKGCHTEQNRENAA